MDKDKSKFQKAKGREKWIRRMQVVDKKNMTEKNDDNIFTLSPNYVSKSFMNDDNESFPKYLICHKWSSISDAKSKPVSKEDN
mgnify:CR=1 FL=1